MYFLIDHNKKVIFGWSAKCGCSHVKKIFRYLQSNVISKKIHQNDWNELPSNIEDYTVILTIRNPFERLVSGFLDKYKRDGEFRFRWKRDNITFSDFVNELLRNKWRRIEKHHFTPQTSETFNKEKLLTCKNLKIYDLSNIDYSFIENIYEKKIPEELISFRGDHSYKPSKSIYDGDVYNLDMDVYINHIVPIQSYYNGEIKNKILGFYENDFTFFKNNGLDYTDKIC